MTERCEICRYSHPHGKDCRKPGNEWMIDWCECGRYPPQWLPWGSSYQDAAFPWVKKAGYCGEWKKRKMERQKS